MSAESLYHRALVEAARAAHGAGRLDAPDGSATVYNPLCGDRVTVDLRLEGGRVAAIAQEVKGCVLCEAAGSLIGAHAPGETAESLRGVAGRVQAMLKGEPPPGGPWAALEAFTPVRAYKSRHECVMLPFQALAQALAQALVQAGA